MVHANGRGFSLYLFGSKVFPDTFQVNKQFKRKETPFFMPLIFENNGFRLRQRSRKLFIE
jgi:hypothetical protein